MNIDHICIRCNGDKNINGFACKGRNPKVCRKCHNEDCKRYKRNNRDKVSEYNKKYKKEHVEEIKEYNANYDKENRETLRVKRHEYSKNRLKTDPEFKLICNLRKRLCSIAKLKGNKNSKTLDLLGCSLEFLRKWLEFQFTPEMTFENYGSYWHIDHVTPCSSFDMTNKEQQNICFNWKNLQPLYCKDNLSKNGKIIEEIIEEHKKKVEKFLKIHNNTQ
jgi:hypothetical protein